MGTENLHIEEKWIKASVLGTIWAASEIVLGSFLHNFRIPFSGNILTGIGLIILISVSFTWKEKGLFWRAGIICALMKTMSPSAVIFGPMIAIFSESLLLEFSTRIFGLNYTGYILGSILAMSWNLFQRIMNFIIFYGLNIVNLYADIIKFTKKSFHIQTDILWLPIIILLVIYGIMGIVAAVIAIKVGKKLKQQPAQSGIPLYFSNEAQKKEFNKKPFHYSITWLLVSFFMMAGGLVTMNYSPWFIWVPLIIFIVVLWTMRYPRALRQISNPKFWLYFAGITFLAGIVFSEIQTGKSQLINGLYAGIEMNFRAVLMITGFSVLGTEFYNPVIRQFFMKTYFKQLPLAMELSFQSLPVFIEQIPDYKTFFKRPVSSLFYIVSLADARLSSLREADRPEENGRDLQHP